MRIAVAGTGTEIGKTHVACALAREVGKARRVLALKPIESGGVADAEALSAACGIATQPLYALKEPLSPHLAARKEGRAIDVTRVLAWVEEREREARSEVTIVETAGGLFSPLGPQKTNATLIRALAPDVLLVVAPDRLGVLHDVTATLLAWGKQEAGAVLLAMSAPSQADAATSSNAVELATLGIAEVAAVFPRAPLDAAETASAAARLAARLTERAAT